MRKISFFLLFTISTLTILAQEMPKFSYETGVGIAWEPTIGLPCANTYNTLNYNLGSRFSISGNIGVIQSFNVENDYKKNASSMTIDANLNYSILRFNKNSLIIGAGLSLLKGSLSYDDGLQNYPIHNIEYLSNLGVNALIKYRYFMSEKWSGSITFRTFVIDPTVFSNSFSSITYGWIYSF